MLPFADCSTVDVQNELACIRDEAYKKDDAYDSLRFQNKRI